MGEWANLDAAELNSICEADSVFEQRNIYADADDRLDGYKRLVVWQVSMEFVSVVYRLSHCLPKEELYGLVSQMRRAAMSVPLNIAEGWARNTKPEFARFCNIARGSLHESDCALELAIRLHYLEASETIEATSYFRRVGTMLLKLVNKLTEKSI